MTIRIVVIPRSVSAQWNPHLERRMRHSQDREGSISFRTFRRYRCSNHSGDCRLLQGEHYACSKQSRTKRNTGINGATARDAVANLRQSIQELQAAQQRAAEHGLQRQISAEQGERKLLSEQLGALSARVDSLQGSNAAAPLSPQQPAKKGRGR
jgi:uncharacterized coiled-coil protein SlyX